MKTKIYGEVEPIVELLSFAYPTTEIFKDDKGFIVLDWLNWWKILSLLRIYSDEFKEISFDDIDGKSLPTKDSFFKKDLMGEWNNEDFDKLEKELK